MASSFDISPQLPVAGFRLPVSQYDWQPATGNWQLLSTYLEPSAHSR
jgi:hypothetical protein